MTETNINKRVNAFWGGLFLLSAAILSCLIFADRWTDLPIRFPSFWYTSRGLHLGVCVGLYVCSWLALRNSSVPASDDESAEPVFRSFNFYTRPDCKLCDEAFAILSQYSAFLPTANVINIDEDKQLQDKFTDCVPVIEFDGRIVFRGRVSQVLLERLITARRNQRLNQRISHQEENEAGQGE